MEKDRGTRVMAIVALLLGVTGLTIGFAAFSTTLTIQSSAKVTPSNDKFTINFSVAEDEIKIEPVIPVKHPTDIEATNGVIDNSSNPTISNLSATFTKPGQKVTYKFYAHNSGEYTAYLKNIIFENVMGSSSNRVCVASEGATDALVQAACDDIVLSFKVGNSNSVIGSQANIVNHVLSGVEPIEVTIEYLSGGDTSDGDFVVKFGNVLLEYRTAD